MCSTFTPLTGYVFVTGVRYLYPFNRVCVCSWCEVWVLNSSVVYLTVMTESVIHTFVDGKNEAPLLSENNTLYNWE